jgi:hypothetical protein
MIVMSTHIVIVEELLLVLVSVFILCLLYCISTVSYYIHRGM